MSIKIVNNFYLYAKAPIDARSYAKTIDDMYALDLRIIPYGFMCYVEENDCIYRRTPFDTW